MPKSIFFLIALLVLLVSQISVVEANAISPLFPFPASSYTNIEPFGSTSYTIAHWTQFGYDVYSLNQMVEYTLKLTANLAIVNLRDGSGNVYFGDFWNSDNSTKIDLTSLVLKFHAKGVKVIGDVGGLSDPHWIETHDDSGSYIWNPATSSYERSSQWLEPYYVWRDLKGATGYKAYAKSIVKAAFDLGVDGINFDDQLIVYPLLGGQSPEFKEWGGIPQRYTGEGRYFAVWNETDRKFFGKRSEVISGIARDWVGEMRTYRPRSSFSVYIYPNPSDHLGGGVNIKTYSEPFDMLLYMAYTDYATLDHMKTVKSKVSRPLYVILYSDFHQTQDGYLNNKQVMRDQMMNAAAIGFKGIGIFSINGAYDNGIHDFVRDSFIDFRHIHRIF